MTVATHRMSKTSEFRIWNSMIQRCHNANDHSFERYGALGVTVCAEWRKDFIAFLEAVGPRPSKSHSIDRIKNDRGYEPGNVRWATLVEQANNKRNNHVVSYRGERMTIAQATRAAGSLVTRETARCRINNGWEVTAAVETPPLFRRDAQRRKIAA